MDCKLKFDLHIDYICTKISRSVGILLKVRNCFPLSIMIKLYFAIVFPYINYCNLVWGGAYITHLNQLIIIQKKVIRIIHEKPFLFHTNELFLSSNLLKINDIHLFSLGLYVFKNYNIINSERPRPYNTRQANFLTPSYHRLTLTQKSPSYLGPVFWNSLPDQLKSLDSVPAFKRLLKRYLIDLYEDHTH